MSRTGLPAALAIFLLVQTAVSASPAQPATQTVHVVQAGESVWTIARQHRVQPDLIARANRLKDPDRLQIGDRLAVPAVAPRGTPAANPPPAAAPAATVHVVRPGESLWVVARSHATTVEALAKLNRLQDVDRVQPGQKILLPDPAAGRRRPSGPAARAAPAPISRTRLQWRWPSRGVVTSRFGFRGRRHHHGIDIAAPVGTPIYAVRDGTVRFTGRRGGYGLLVVLDHGDGLTTWYGHASRIMVTVGETVRQGDTIAAVGTTGNVTGPNVHFEVRRNNVPLDPLKFLQRR